MKIATIALASMSANEIVDSGFELPRLASVGPHAPLHTSS